ncbi:MAG: hypothetical protein IPN38_12325 [Flavobacteriales bacterium]|nr:hypothetical protein [Flavobacteriales bacterium]
MELRKHLLPSAALVALLFATTTTALAEEPPATAESVVLTGWLHVEDLSFDLTTVEADVNGAVLYAAVSKTGRFTLNLPINANAVLRFEHPGHLPKQVLVDTHFADAGEAASTRDTSVLLWYWSPNVTWPVWTTLAL